MPKHQPPTELGKLEFRNTKTQPPTTCAITTTLATVLGPIWLHLDILLDDPTYVRCFNP
jgi:hypothetical protein